MPRRIADDIDKCIGENIFNLRRRNRLSRNDLCSLLKHPVSSQAFVKYEDGRTRIPAATIVELAYLFQVPLMELFKGVDALLPHEAPTVDNPALANIASAMVKYSLKGIKAHE